MIVKKVISIFILTALILSVTACKADTSSDETKSAVRDTMPEIEIKNPRELIREDLPVKDYGGYDFRIMLADEDIYSFDVIPTEQNGDRLNDATYMRDQLVSERFGVKITHYQAGSRDDLGNKAYASVMAGDDTFDVLKVVSWSAQKLVNENLFMNWGDVPYIDLDKPWWNQKIREGVSIKNNIIWMNSDISINDYSTSFGLIFNKNLFDSYDFEYPYHFVKDMKWTREAMEIYLKVTPADLNGDGLLKFGDDLFGVGTNPSDSAQFLYMWDSQIISKDKDDLPYLNFNSQRTVDIVNTLYDWLYDKQYVNIYSTTDYLTP